MADGRQQGGAAGARTGAARGAVDATRPSRGSTVGAGATPGGAAIPIADAAARRFEHAAGTPAAVRAFARSTLDGWGVVPDEAVLIVHELVTVRSTAMPAGAPFTVALSRSDFRIRIEVTGGGPADSCSSPSAAGDDLGRGLVMVRSLARTWGLLVRDGGTTAWAEIDAHR